MYASDDPQGRLPRFDWNGGGGKYLWDVSTNMISNLAPYGLTVAMWYDPVRAEELDADQQAYGKPFAGIQDLENYVCNYAHGIRENFNEAVIRFNWWMQRSQSVPASSSLLYPADTEYNPNFLLQNLWAKGTPLGNFGTPKMASKTKSWNLVPFISCAAGSSVLGAGFNMPRSGVASKDPNDCSHNTAHFYNGALKGVNAAYGDGHVEAHNKQQMTCGYGNGDGVGPGNDPYWFY